MNTFKPVSREVFNASVKPLIDALGEVCNHLGIPLVCVAAISGEVEQDGHKGYRMYTAAPENDNGVPQPMLRALIALRAESPMECFSKLAALAGGSIVEVTDDNLETPLAEVVELTKPKHTLQ